MPWKRLDVEEGQPVVNTRDSALRLDFSSNFKYGEAKLMDIKNIRILNKHKNFQRHEQDNGNIKQEQEVIKIINLEYYMQNFEINKPTVGLTNSVDQHKIELGSQILNW